MQGFRRARGLAPTLAAAIAALCALMALAGPASAHNGSHEEDDSPAGTIASYDADSGKLTIDLADGGSISGIVTGRTWIDDGERGCGDERQAKTGRKGAKAARQGDWCNQRRNGDHEHGDDHGWRHGSGEASDLVEGAVVEDAILVLKDGKAWYAKVELEG